MTITITSRAFEPNQPIPRRYTGEGQDISPPLSWSNLPEGTKELALIIDDPDAPTAEPWIHWLLYKIPAETQGLEENIPPSARIPSPPGALSGKNSWNNHGYGGPMPPKGHGQHRYFFKLYALDTTLDLAPGTDKKTLLNAIAGHILAEGELIGTYQR
ncbi:MAG: YbhB/YbcL family Raf kinase inhibitor-like protein [Planctomycetota bacterium]